MLLCSNGSLFATSSTLWKKLWSQKTSKFFNSFFSLITFPLLIPENFRPILWIVKSVDHIRKLILLNIDLVAVPQKVCQKFFKKNPNPIQKEEDLFLSGVKEALSTIFEHLGNSDGCQFSIKQLQKLNQENNWCFRERWCKNMETLYSL